VHAAKPVEFLTIPQNVAFSRGFASNSIRAGLDHKFTKQRELYGTSFRRSKRQESFRAPRPKPRGFYDNLTISKESGEKACAGCTPYNRATPGGAIPPHRAIAKPAAGPGERMPTRPPTSPAPAQSRIPSPPPQDTSGAEPAGMDHSSRRFVPA